MTNIAMATLGLCLTAVGVVFLFWVTAKVLFPEPIVDRHEQGDDL